MEFKAYKMDGLGNDFVIIDQRIENIQISKDQIVKICDRNFIGCDQLIFIKKNDKLDANLEFYNSDGSFSGACGNGTRCVAYLLSKEKNKSSIDVQTSSGILNSKILKDKLVETKIGIPKTKWNEIPLNKKLNTKNLNFKILDKKNNEFIGGIAINVGNPHIVFFVKNLKKINLKKVGPKIEKLSLFPERINVNFAKILNNNKIALRVWERGAGITKACGTGASAATIAAIKNKLINKKTCYVQMEGGELKIEYKKNGHIVMTGPIKTIKKGVLNNFF